MHEPKEALIAAFEETERLWTETGVRGRKDRSGTTVTVGLIIGDEVGSLANDNFPPFMFSPIVHGFLHV